jgi:4-aminobutyrate aminotransferase
VPPKDVAAILVEPIQGEGGYIVPPDGFLAGLRALCDKHGILLIFDEVQAGIGRTGKMFASQHWGVVPDIMTLAKGLGSGIPVGMVVAKKSIMSQWKKGAHGNTYGGNPIAAAAAMATLDVVENGLMQNAATVGAYFMDRLRELQARHTCIGEVRGKGLMIGCEFVKEDGSAAQKMCDDIILRAYHHGLLLLPCGLSTVRFMPPLLITTDEVDEAIEMLEGAIKDVVGA